MGSKDGKELWLANLTPETAEGEGDGPRRCCRIHRLSDGNFTALATKPDFLSRPGERVKKLSSVELGPYGVVRIKTG
jgi:hypothetical protein